MRGGFRPGRPGPYPGAMPGWPAGAVPPGLGYAPGPGRPYGGPPVGGPVPMMAPGAAGVPPYGGWRPGGPGPQPFAGPPGVFRPAHGAPPVLATAPVPVVVPGGTVHMPVAAHVHPASVPATGMTATDEQIVDEDRGKWRTEAAKWSEHKAEEEGTFYYYNSETGESVWKCPPALAMQKELDSAGFVMEKIDGTTWHRVYSADGDFYYHNPETQASIWTLPQEVEELIRKRRQPHVAEAQENAAPVEPEEYTEEPQEAEEEGEEEEEEEKMEATEEPAEEQVQPRSEMELESGEDAIAKFRQMEAERALDAVKRKLGDMEENPVDAEVQKRAKVDTESAGESQTSASTEEGEEDGGDISSEEQQSRIEQFKNMLREKKLTPFSKWEKELPKLCVDPRFKVLPRHADRRAVFEAYVKNILNEERATKRARAQAAKEGFEKLLEEKRDQLTADTRWADFEKLIEKDPRYKAMGETSADRKERRSMFDAIVTPLRQAKEKEMQEKRKEARKGFMQLLEETKEIDYHARWSKVKGLLEKDPRYSAVESAREREDLFDEYLNSISEEFRKKQRMASAEERLKEREREVRRRREKEEREMDEQRSKVRLEEAIANFEALLSERVKQPDASWRDVKRSLESDRRYSSPLLTSEQKEKLFKKHSQKLLTDRFGVFKMMLAETDKIHMATTWDEARALVQDDARWKLVADDSERRKIFFEHQRDLHDKARHDFMALLEETNKETMAITPTTTAADWPKIEQLIRGDKRYKAFNVRPEERLRLLEEFIAGVGRPKPEDRRSG